MEDKIKQKIEKQSFIIYPIDLKGTGLDWNKALRDEWVKGAEYGYNIKENVNEKLVEALKKIREISLEDFEWAVGSPSMAINSIAKEAILSASNQENNEGWLSVNERNPEPLKNVLIAMKYPSGKINYAITCMIKEDDGSLYWDSRDEEDITHWKELIYPNPPKEK